MTVVNDLIAIVEQNYDHLTPTQINELGDLVKEACNTQDKMNELTIKLNKKRVELSKYLLLNNNSKN